MDRTNPYFNQVSLLVRLLPLLTDASCFALKGGTAINLFYREMPRLSVDIDLVYVTIADRTSSLAEMTQELQKIGKRIGSLYPESRIQYSFLNKTEYVTRLLIEWEKAVVKIELSSVLRGTVFKPEIRRISRTAEDAFGLPRSRLCHLKISLQVRSSQHWIGSIPVISSISKDFLRVKGYPGS